MNKRRNKSLKTDGTSYRELVTLTSRHFSRRFLVKRRLISLSNVINFQLRD